MFKKVLLLAAVLACGLILAEGTVWGQAPDAPPSRPTLADRFQQLRRTLFGEPDEPRMATRPTEHRTPVNPSPHMHRYEPHANRVQASPARPSTSSTPGRTDGPLPSRAMGNSRASDTSTPATRVHTGGVAGDDLPVERPLPSPDSDIAPSSRRRVRPLGTATPSDGVVGERSNAAPIVVSQPEESDEPAPSYTPLAEQTHVARAPEHSSSTEETIEPSAAPIETDRRPQAADEAGDHVLLVHESPQMRVETSGPRKITVGREATYRVVLENTGQLTATNVQVVVTIPPWAEVVSAQSTIRNTQVANTVSTADGFHWQIDNLQGNSREELNLSIVPRKSETFDMGIRWSCSPVASKATIEVQQPKLHIAVSGPKEVEFGRRETFTLIVTNPGTGTAQNVVVHLMPLDSSDRAVASQKLGTLLPGESRNVEVELTARQVGRLAIRAGATADDSLDVRVAEEILVRCAAMEVGIEGPKVHYAGAPAAFEVRVSNTGNAPARKVKVAATLPPQAKYISSSGGGQFDHQGNKVAWSLDQIPAGTEKIFVFECSILSAGANQIEVVSTADGDLLGRSVVTTKVIALADLVLEVDEAPGPIPVGEKVTYRVRIHNRGTKTAEKVDMVAYFSQGIEAVSVKGGSHTIRPGMVVFDTIGQVAAGQEIVYQITARAEESGNHRFRVELVCDTIGAKLTREDTAFFYSSDDTSQGAIKASPEGDAAQGQARDSDTTRQ